MAHTNHGEIVNQWLYKRGKSVVKFWREEGYAIPVEELLKVKGVKLYTQYDGNLKADRETFNSFGIPHIYTDDKGRIEHQIILKVNKWEKF